MLLGAAEPVVDLRIQGALIANRPDTTLPGVGLVIAGVVNLIYAAMYAIWTGVGLMGGGLVAMGQLAALAGATDAKVTAGSVIIGLVSALAPLVQLIVYLGVGLGSLIVLFGGVRLISGYSKGIVYLAATCAIAGPLFGLFANALSFCNVSTMGMCVFGFLGGSAGSLVPLVVCAPLSIWAFVAASKPGYAAED